MEKRDLKINVYVLAVAITFFVLGLFYFLISILLDAPPDSLAFIYHDQLYYGGILLLLVSGFFAFGFLVLQRIDKE